MEVDVDDWRGPNAFIWCVMLPLVAAGANLIPRPQRFGGSNPERHWLPLFNYGLWVAGSAVHVWCVAHICAIPLELHHLAPTVCVAAWTGWNRLYDCMPNPSIRWQQALLTLAGAAPLLAFTKPELMLVLTALNFVGFLAVGLRARGGAQSMAKHLATASAALLFASIPEAWGRELFRNFAREHRLAFAGSFYLLLIALRSTRPETGLFAAIAVGIDASWLAPSQGPFFGLQAGLVFLMIHSLSWTDAVHPGARLLRWLAAGGWFVHAAIWTNDGGWLSAIVTGSGAVLVTSAWLISWRNRGQRGPGVLLGAATLTLLSAPGNWSVRFGSDGLLAVGGAFALFAIGLIVAWTRHRWEHRGSTATGDG
jgi:hypothetical protein